ncbi:MAG: hypothetical protein WCD70_11445 [Alphaproteobacteria bacterium]
MLISRFILAAALSMILSACAPPGKLSVSKDDATAADREKDIADCKAAYAQSPESTGLIENLAHFAEIDFLADCMFAKGWTVMTEEPHYDADGQRRDTNNVRRPEPPMQTIKPELGLKLCNRNPNDPEGTLLQFFYYQAATPNRECLYLLSKNNIPLTASQVTPRGALVGASWSKISRFIFLYNDNQIEANLVDGAVIQPGYFVYAGNFSYESYTGSRRVYSFRRIENPFVGSPTKP